MSLSTDELDLILSKNSVTKKFYVGTFPSCIFPSTRKRRYAFITNTDNHHESGTHWNAWFISDNQLTFFDSFGRSYGHPDFPETYGNFARRFNKISHSVLQIQSKDSWMCGYFCVKFLYLQCLGLNLKQFLEEFSTNLIVNDYNVLDFVDSII